MLITAIILSITLFFGVLAFVLIDNYTRPQAKPQAKPQEPQRVIFTPLDVASLTHHIKDISPDTEPYRQLAEYTIRAAGIKIDTSEAFYGTGTVCITLKLTYQADYNKALTLLTELQAQFNNDAVTISREGNKIRVDIPVNTADTLYLGDMLKSEAYSTSDRLDIAIGKATDGKNVFADIEELKHILIAGTTGSGKSVFLHNILLSILAKHNDTQIYIIDPKMVEFSAYKTLKCCHIVTETADSIGLLTYMCQEMDKRYSWLAAHGYRDISSANANNAGMPHIIIMVDELGDLMTTAKKQIEPLLVRLAQKARACGIHLILATQYPTANIITGAIKQNMPTKICFAVPTTTASVVMLGRKGAERLRGKGDMLYQTERDISPTRLQAPYATDNDIYTVIANNYGIAA